MSRFTIGPRGIAILRTVSHGRGFVCSTESQYRSALKLHQRGLVDRDLGIGMAKRFIGNEAGTKFIIAHDDALARKADLE